jgi:hypothetical protein
MARLSLVALVGGCKVRQRVPAATPKKALIVHVSSTYITPGVRQVDNSRHHVDKVRRVTARLTAVTGTG